jgi:DNA-binding NtrC family response regulator
MNQPHILVVDDEEPVRELLRDALTDWAFRVTTAETGAEAMALVTTQLIDVALLDIWMPGTNGLKLLREIRRHDPEIEVVMMTGDPAVGTAVEALKLGAYDYLVKPLNLDELRHLMARLSDHRFLRRQVHTLRRRLAERPEVTEFVGVSPQIERVRELVAKVAASDSPVVIEGETGTGKELIAASIHRGSSRATGPFVPVNCGAIPANLLESEFFGHVRGAFSGAVSDAPGLFRAAHGGTIFLDELTELPTALQAKLLRVLQEQEVRPVGSAKTHPVDVRILAATNRRLEAAIADGSLRPDLFYRLDVIRIVIPPLRERKEDLPALLAHFLRQLNARFGREVKGISPGALAQLVACDFPGNVRELENLLERAYVLGARYEITPADLRMVTGRPETAVSSSPPLPTLAEAERALILRSLELHGNSREAAARALGISNRTIYRRLREYGIQPAEAGGAPRAESTARPRQPAD